MEPRRRPDIGLIEGLVGLGLAPPQDRLHHHDGAVDDDAEVDRAQRQQVGGDPGVVHQNERDTENVLIALANQNRIRIPCLTSREISRPTCAMTAAA